MDIHQLCLYILGGAGSRQGNCIFHPRTFSCHCPGSVSSDFHSMAAPGSAPLHLRRAGLTSVASVEECDDCRLYHSDSETHEGFALRRSAPPWCWETRPMFLLRSVLSVWAGDRRFLCKTPKKSTKRLNRFYKNTVCMLIMIYYRIRIINCINFINPWGNYFVAGAPI